MLTDKQLATLKNMLMEQKTELMDNNDTLQGSLRDSTDELSTIDNHPADLATELYEREKDMALQVHHDDQLSEIDAALERMSEGTYGTCLTCHAEIPFERLEAIPSTAYCVEHSETKNIPSDRPIEEDMILPAVDNSFSGREANDTLQDDEDSFRLVAQYGSSDTPADFEGDIDSYNDLYKDKDSMPSNLDDLHVSQVDFLEGQISKEYAENAARDDYLE